MIKVTRITLVSFHTKAADGYAYHARIHHKGRTCSPKWIMRAVNMISDKAAQHGFVGGEWAVRSYTPKVHVDRPHGYVSWEGHASSIGNK